MTDQIEQEVREKIQHFKAKYGNGWGSYFFNNLHADLPGGYRTKSDPDILDMRVYANSKAASERRRPQSGREFQAECLSAVQEAGFEPEDIVSAKLEGGERLFDTLLPIYIILRRRGYNHYPDLTS